MLSFNNEEYKWVENYADRKIGHSYTYFVNSYREDFNVGLAILSGQKTVIMEKGISSISIPLNLVEAPLYSVEIDLQERDIVLIDNENFNISKNGTVTLEMSMLSTAKFETDMGDVIEWQLTPMKVLKKLANRSGYQLEETIDDPGYYLSLGEFKISQKKDFSTKFNEGIYEEFGETYLSFSVEINEEGYLMDYNSNSSDISLYVFDKHGNEKFVDVYDELVVGDIVRVYYTNNNNLDFSLTFEKNEDDINIDDFFKPSVNFTIIQQFGINEDEAEVSFVIDDMGKNVESVRLSNIGIDNDIIVRNDDNYVVDILQENIESGDSFYLETQKEGQFNIVDFSYVIELEDGTIIENTVDLNIDLGEYIKD